jgi:hypothetical protein
VGYSTDPFVHSTPLCFKCETVELECARCQEEPAAVDLSTRTAKRRAKRGISTDWAWVGLHNKETILDGLKKKLPLLRKVSAYGGFGDKSSIIQNKLTKKEHRAHRWKFIRRGFKPLPIEELCSLQMSIKARVVLPIAIVQLWRGVVPLSLRAPPPAATCCFLGSPSRKRKAPQSPLYSPVTPPYSPITSSDDDEQ